MLSTLGGGRTQDYSGNTRIRMIEEKERERERVGSRVNGIKMKRGKREDLAAASLIPVTVDCGFSAAHTVIAGGAS